MEIIKRSAYPALLQQSGVEPPQLWVKGNLGALHTTTITIVGTRTMSGYAQTVIDLLIPPLVRAGLSVVSGLALGVDGAVHRKVLQCEGTCIAVLGSGIQAIYPRTHITLAADITKQGAIVSAYAPCTQVHKRFFPERNRILAGLSMVTLVIEAGEKSGSLITARAAASMGRDVAVVPGDITRTGSIGCSQLLQEGAKAVHCAEDILALYQLSLPLSVVTSVKPALTGTMATLYATISNGAHTVDAIVRATGFSISTTQSALSLLEIEGYICQRQQQWRAIS